MTSDSGSLQDSHGDEDRLFRLDLIYSYVARLEQFSVRLRILGLVMIMFTLIHFLGFILVAGPIRVFRFEVVWIFSLATFGTIFMFAVFFEYVKKRASSIYTEISDAIKQQVEEDMLSSGISEKQTSRVRKKFSDLRVMARIATKEYVHNSELPLIPGNFGPATIIGVNVLLTMLMANLKF